MAEISPREFLELLKKSGLVERQVLKESLKQLNDSMAGEPVRLNRLTAHLVDSGLLTEWHRDKLLEGKYRGFVLGQYNLLRLLGVGGMSTVFLAEHKLGAQRRAIKVLPKQRAADKSYLDRFYQEGRAAAALNHPNIVRIYDLASDDDVHYMVMEYVEGIDLQEMVKRDGPLPVGLALDYLKQAATGLRHAHERGIVHRDVKPSNLLASPSGTLKVLDLGLALMFESAESLTLLHNDRVMGTADYLSPEQAINSHEVDHRTDLYSLGCTMHFLLTGRPPFPDGSIAQRIAQHATVEPPLISQINPACPESVAQMVHVMMRKSRDDRPQSCREVIAEIRAIQAGLAPTDPLAGRTDMALADASLEARAMVHQGLLPDSAGRAPEPLLAAAVGRQGRQDAPPVAPPRPVPVSGGTSRNGGKAGRPAGSRSATDGPSPATARGPVASPENPAAAGRAAGNGTRNGSPARQKAVEKRSGPVMVVIPDTPVPPQVESLDGLRTPEHTAHQLIQGRKKHRRGQATWLVGGIIAVMFVVLLAVLVVALRIVQ